MENLFNHIKVKSLAWIENRGMTFVVENYDSVKKDHYYRSPGGSIEYGESSREAVIREIMEELETGIEVVGEPLVVENIFTCDGKAGHEINFIYPCTFVDETFYENKTYRLIEGDGKEFKAMWVSIEDCLNGRIRLVPKQVMVWWKHKPLD